MKGVLVMDPFGTSDNFFPKDNQCDNQYYQYDQKRMPDRRSNALPVASEKIPDRTIECDLTDLTNRYKKSVLAIWDFGQPCNEVDREIGEDFKSTDEENEAATRPR